MVEKRRHLVISMKQIVPLFSNFVNILVENYNESLFFLPFFPQYTDWMILSQLILTTRV